MQVCHFFRLRMCTLTAATSTMTMRGTSTQKMTMPAVAPGGNENGQQSVTNVAQFSPLSTEQISSPQTIVKDRGNK